MLSLCAALTKEKDAEKATEVALFHGCSDKVMERETVEQRISELGNAKLILSLSQPPADWEGRKGILDHLRIPIHLFFFSFPFHIRVLSGASSLLILFSHPPGRFDAGALRELLGPDGKREGDLCCICGPLGFVETAKAILTEFGYDKENWFVC